MEEISLQTSTLLTFSLNRKLFFFLPIGGGGAWEGDVSLQVTVLL